MSSLNGGYAMIKYNSTQEELAIAYKSKRPALFYDENQRAHWAVIEETATESVDEETQEPITLYKYSYRLIDNNESGEVHLYEHIVHVVVTYQSFGEPTGFCFTLVTNTSNSITPTYIRDQLKFDGTNNYFYINALGKDKRFTQRFYIDSNGRLRMYGFSLEDWSAINNITAYSQEFKDIVTQIF